MKETGDPLITGIIKAEKERLVEYQKLLNIRVSKAMDEVRSLTKQFREIDPQLKKVILFGSLAEHTVTSENFDIDLAVESGKYLQIVSIALDSEFKVDVVEIETLPEHLQRRVLDKGQVLYKA